MMIEAVVMQAAPAEAAIAAAMADSAAGWNGGDLGRFMGVYAEDAVYVTSAGVVQGKAAISARYAKSFAGGGNTRGRLSFVPMVQRAMGPGYRLYVARWTLTPIAGGKVQTGMTSLVFTLDRGRWRIVSDHSS